MSAEPRRDTNTEVWTQYEGQTVNGVFPLRRFLGGSGHNAVFLSEYPARNLRDVAIKLAPADGLQAEAQLAHWGAAATLSHPHLVRLFDLGRCTLGAREFIFVVMEYADQTLAQILARRTLNSDEVQEMLLPTLDALAFLHRNHLVHGQLKPSNLLAVDDQLKLASDTLRTAGHSLSGSIASSPYDPPELKDRGVSSAGDIWSLGITLVEALTQRTPAWSDEQREAPSLPASLPAPFANAVRRCLSRAPDNRPTVVELETLYKPTPQTHSIPDPQPPVQESPREATATQSSPKRPLWLVAVAAALLISIAVWFGLHSSGSSQAHLPPPAVATVAPVAPATIAKPAESSAELSSPAAPAPAKSSPQPTDTSSSILLEVKPDVPKSILDKIRGRIPVTVRVLVDPSGNVIGALMENPGPSKYFARRAGEAAKEWKFAPADNQAARVWLLSFTFTRDGATTRATAVR